MTSGIVVGGLPARIRASSWACSLALDWGQRVFTKTGELMEIDCFGKPYRRFSWVHGSIGRCGALGRIGELCGGNRGGRGGAG